MKHLKAFEGFQNEINFRKTNERTEEYKGSKIVAWQDEWEEMGENGNLQRKRQIFCHIYRLGSKHQPLNLGECNDGSKFTSVNQAVNQGKEFIDICNRLEEEEKKNKGVGNGERKSDGKPTLGTIDISPGKQD